MTWMRGRRELCFSGRLPLEQGIVFEQAVWDIAKTERAADKKAGAAALDWQQSAADALVTLAQRGGSGGLRRSPTTLIVHVSGDAPPLLEGAGPLSPETAERLSCDARRLTIKLRIAISCTRASGAARPTRGCAHCTSAHATASTPVVPLFASSKPTTSSRTHPAV
jgi:hypothetical protein